MENNELDEYRKSHINFNFLLFLTFITGVLLITATYAWFYASLDVRVEFVKIDISKEAGLSLSLDGINFSETVEVTQDSITKDIMNLYPTNTNQYPSSGLYPISTIGIQNPNQDKFQLYVSTRLKYLPGYPTLKRYLNVKKYEEVKSQPESTFLAFDLFVQNATGSPYDDNFFLDEGTEIYLHDGYETNDGNYNSIRIGFLKMGTVSRRTDAATRQAIDCQGHCEAYIYEPTAFAHSESSIKRAKKIDINLVDGEYKPTYAVIADGKYMDISTGYSETGLFYDRRHFQEQITRTELVGQLCTIANGITKFRVYVWLEGQDADSLQTTSAGSLMTITLKFHKDLEGYNH